MNTDRLNAIKARLTAATPGPWQAGNDQGFWGQDCVIEANDPEVGRVTVCDFVHVSACEEIANIAFISQAPQDVADLLAEVARLQAANAELVEACEAVNEYLSAIPCDPAVLLIIRKAITRAKGE